MAQCSAAVGDADESLLIDEFFREVQPWKKSLLFPARARQ
jgi:hypothetical protein